MLPPLAVVQAKKRRRAAYHGARKTDTTMSAIYDRWWSETLLAIKGKLAGRRAEMLRRTAIL
jgi:hypothetical protein